MPLSNAEDTVNNKKTDSLQTQNNHKMSWVDNNNISYQPQDNNLTGEDKITSVCNKSAELNPVRHWKNKSKILVKSNKMQPQQRQSVGSKIRQTEKCLISATLATKPSVCNKIYNTADAGRENIENRKQAGAECAGGRNAAAELTNNKEYTPDPST